MFAFRAAFARAGEGWKKRCTGQATTWYGGMKKLVSVSVSFGASRLRDWGQLVEDCCWMETLKNMVQNVIQRHE